jgi:hypothetical protein
MSQEIIPPPMQLVPATDSECLVTVDSQVQNNAQVWHKRFCHINVSSLEVKFKVITLKTDRGGEFRSNAFKQYLINTRIQHGLTAPYAPE